MRVAAKKPMPIKVEVKPEETTTTTTVQAKTETAIKKVKAGWDYAHAHPFMTGTFNHFESVCSLADKVMIGKSLAVSLNGKMGDRSREVFVKIITNFCHLRIVHSLCNAGQEVPYRYRPDGGFSFVENIALSAAMPFIRFTLQGATDLPSFKSIISDAFYKYHDQTAEGVHKPKYSTEEAGVQFSIVFNELRTDKDNITVLRAAIEDDERLASLRPIFFEEPSLPKEAVLPKEEALPKEETS